MSAEKPPRVGLGVLKRALVAALLIPLAAEERSATAERREPVEPRRPAPAGRRDGARATRHDRSVTSRAGPRGS